MGNRLGLTNRETGVLGTGIVLGAALFRWGVKRGNKKASIKLLTNITRTAGAIAKSEEEAFLLAAKANKVVNVTKRAFKDATELVEMSSKL